MQPLVSSFLGLLVIAVLAVVLLPRPQVRPEQTFVYAAANGGLLRGADRLADGFGLAALPGAMKRSSGDGQSEGTWQRRTGNMPYATARLPLASLVVRASVWLKAISAP